MPTFCRHNRLIQNCPICAREQSVELRPVVTPGGRPEPRPRPPAPSRAASAGRAGGRAATPRSARAGGMVVRRLARETGDGYRSALVPGLHAAADAARLAEEIAFAATRLQILSTAPPGLYAEVADPAAELDERLWLAVQIAVLSPRDAGADEDPFATIDARRTSWASGATPVLDGADTGPRAAADPGRALAGYRAWAARQGGQAAALGGDAGWTEERRFDRGFERLGTVAGMDRVPRYDLLVTVGRLAGLGLLGTRLHVGASDPVTLAAKRILGIGDPLLLERRAQELAAATGLPVEALDLGFFNWERGTRTSAGLPAETPVDADALGAARVALGLD
jgi:hypothetical protein